MRRDVYFGFLKLKGGEGRETLTAANNCAVSLLDLHRYAEVRSVMRKEMHVAQSVLGQSNQVTLKMRWNYGLALYRDPGATLDGLREAVTTLEETERIARRVLGGAHPTTVEIEEHLRNSRTALRARETPDA